MTPLRRLLRRWRNEDGISLPEIAIAAALLSIVAVAAAAIMTSSHTVLTKETTRSDNNDQLRLAMEQLDREIRSGAIIYSPDTPYSLRVLTKSNAVDRCAQWTIVDRELRRRSWPRTVGATPPDPATVSGWRIVATDLVNVELSVPVFTINATNQGRTVDVTLLSNDAYEKEPNATTRVEQSLTARNTASGVYGPDDCVQPV